MTRYVVGLLFSEDYSQVLLIRKTRPAWQAGKLNGPGGHVEANETDHEAMRREFLEEAGVDVANWSLVVMLEGVDFSVGFYAAADTEALRAAYQAGDEGIELWELAGAIGRRDLMPNLHWILALAADPCCELPFVVTDAATRGDAVKAWDWRAGHIAEGAKQ